MKPNAIAIATTIAVIAILGVTVINATTSRAPIPHQASGTVNVMQMMKAAKGLPEQRYDAN